MWDVSVRAEKHAHLADKWDFVAFTVGGTEVAAPCTSGALEGAQRKGQGRAAKAQASAASDVETKGAEASNSRGC